MSRHLAPCIIVPTNEAERFKRRLDAMGMRDSSLKIKLRGGLALIPLIGDIETEKLFEKTPRSVVKLAKRVFEVEERHKKLTLQALLTEIGPRKTELLPRSYDVIGTVAIIELPTELNDESERIGTAMLALHKQVKSVYAKAGPIEGDYRLRRLNHIAGEEMTETVHIENGCRFRVDVATSFFNPRLAGERMRVAKQVSKGELVLDMFAGVGPFSILIAKLSGAEVISIDSNPQAVRYLRENARLNHVQDRVRVVEGDAAQVTKDLRGVTDRVVMNLPEKSASFIEAACRVLKPNGGMLHFYTFQQAPKAAGKGEELLRSEVTQAGRRVVEIPFSKSFREISPHTYQVVVDAKVK